MCNFYLIQCELTILYFLSLSLLLLYTYGTYYIYRYTDIDIDSKLAPTGGARVYIYTFIIHNISIYTYVLNPHNNRFRVLSICTESLVTSTRIQCQISK